MPNFVDPPTTEVDPRGSTSVVPALGNLGPMPSDRPNGDDIALAKILSERGINRSPRTCLRWRRQGVLIPPSGDDEDDEPIYSGAAIERAVTYARLLDEIGHESAVIALWGNEVGPGIPRATILTALTAAQEAQQKRVETVRGWLDPQAVKHQRLRRERQLIDKLRKVNPDLATALTKHAGDQVADENGMNAASMAANWTKQDDKQDTAPRLGEVRADLLVSAADALVEGHAGASAELVEALGLGADEGVVDVFEKAGGLVPITDQLRTIDACKKDDTVFNRLVDLRDDLRSALLRRGAEIAEVIPFFGSIMASSDPAITGQFIAGLALTSLTYELQKAAETAEPSVVTHLRAI